MHQYKKVKASMNGNAYHNINSNNTSCGNASHEDQIEIKVVGFNRNMMQVVAHLY